VKLTINLATRGRPDLCIETLERTLPNISLHSTKLMVSCDRDDPNTVLALSTYVVDHPNVVLSIRDREDSLGEKYNRALEQPADVYLMMVDYAPHVTPAFDKKILEAASLFPDNIGVVYNRLANASFPEINAVTHGLAKKMGFIYPPWFPYWFVDHWLDDMARLIDRISFADVKLDRIKRPGTQDLRDVTFWATFFDALYLRRRKCAREIIESDDFLDPPWRKQMSLAHFPLIEFRSRWVNDGVRADAKRIEACAGKSLPDEERYARIKTRALELMKELIPDITAEQENA